MEEETLYYDTVVEETAALGNGEHRAIVATADFGRSLGVKFDNEFLQRYRNNPVLLYQHGFDARFQKDPIGEVSAIDTNGNGDLVASFRFYTDDADIARIERMWDKGRIRGVSMGWNPREGKGGALAEISIVTVPWDKNALRLNSFSYNHREEGEMDKETLAVAVKEAVTEAMAQYQPSETASVGEIARQAVAETMERLRTAREEENAAASVNQLAYERAELIVKTQHLLPEGMVLMECSNRDILLAAVGNEIENPQSRDDGYLEATIDQIIARREKFENEPRQDRVDTVLSDAFYALT